MTEKSFMAAEFVCIVLLSCGLDPEKCEKQIIKRNTSWFSLGTNPVFMGYLPSNILGTYQVILCTRYLLGIYRTHSWYFQGNRQIN